MRFKIYLIILILGSVFGLLKFRRLDPSFKLIVVLLIYTFINESIVHYTVAQSYSNSLYYVYAIISSLLYVLILRNWLSIKVKNIISIPSIIFIVLISFFLCDTNNLNNNFPSQLISYLSPILVLNCLLVFTSLVQHPTIPSTSNNFITITCSSIFVYLTITIMYLSVYALTATNGYSMPNYFHILHWLVSIIFYSILSVILFKYKTDNSTSI